MHGDATQNHRQSSMSRLRSDGADDPYRAPTSGGQYHWVSEFAPPEYQKVASYAAGLLSSIRDLFVQNIPKLS